MNGYGSQWLNQAVIFKPIHAIRITDCVTRNAQLPIQAASRSARRSPRVRTRAASFSISPMMATLRPVSSSIDRFGSVILDVAREEDSDVLLAGYCRFSTRGAVS